MASQALALPESVRPPSGDTKRISLQARLRQSRLETRNFEKKINAEVDREILQLFQSRKACAERRRRMLQPSASVDDDSPLLARPSSRPSSQQTSRSSRPQSASLYKKKLRDDAQRVDLKFRAAAAVEASLVDASEASAAAAAGLADGNELTDVAKQPIAADNELLADEEVELGIQPDENDSDEALSFDQPNPAQTSCATENPKHRHSSSVQSTDVPSDITYEGYARMNQSESGDATASTVSFAHDEQVVQNPFDPALMSIVGNERRGSLESQSSATQNPLAASVAAVSSDGATLRSDGQGAAKVLVREDENEADPVEAAAQRSMSSAKRRVIQLEAAVKSHVANNPIPANGTAAEAGANSKPNETVGPDFQDTREIANEILKNHQKRSETVDDHLVRIRQRPLSSNAQANCNAIDADVEREIRRQVQCAKEQAERRQASRRIFEESKSGLQQASGDAGHDETNSSKRPASSATSHQSNEAAQPSAQGSRDSPRHEHDLPLHAAQSTPAVGSTASAGLPFQDKRRARERHVAPKDPSALVEHHDLHSDDELFAGIDPEIAAEFRTKPRKLTRKEADNLFHRLASKSNKCVVAVACFQSVWTC